MAKLCKFPLETPADLTATEAAGQIAQGALTVEALVEACLARIEAIIFRGV